MSNSCVNADCPFSCRDTPYPWKHATHVTGFEAMPFMLHYCDKQFSKRVLSTCPNLGRCGCWQVQWDWLYVSGTTQKKLYELLLSDLPAILPAFQAMSAECPSLLSYNYKPALGKFTCSQFSKGQPLPIARGPNISATLSVCS
jgi:hypothetical protein